MPFTLDDLRRHAVARSLFPPTTLMGALQKLGFVQADPIRAPARAQDLTLRPRVTDYRAGDLERLYTALDVEEDFFVNYGFLLRTVHAGMHPRTGTAGWPAARKRQAKALLAFVRDRGEVHPRDVEDQLSRGTVTNYWGGTSKATTHLLDLMHYHGVLRVARRENGIRVYAVRETDSGPVDVAARRARIDALVDVVVRKYAPLPAPSLSGLVSRLRLAVPQWRGELAQALTRAKRRLSHARIADLDWYWPADEAPKSHAAPDTVRFLAPFDPVVWDRRRFELFWGWAYRFEAYTPVPKRKLGYYAMPLLWRDRVIGWGNISVTDGALHADVGYVEPRPTRDRAFTRELEAELDRMRAFLGLVR